MKRAVKWRVKSSPRCQKCNKSGTVKYIMLLAEMIVTLQFSNALGLFDVRDVNVEP